MLHGMGVETGIDLDKLIAAGKVAAALVGHELPGKVHRAGTMSQPVVQGVSPLAGPSRHKN
jgi:hydroxymethylglutaryl-CoA lyase